MSLAKGSHDLTPKSSLKASKHLESASSKAKHEMEDDVEQFASGALKDTTSDYFVTKQIDYEDPFDILTKVNKPLPPADEPERATAHFEE